MKKLNQKGFAHLAVVVVAALVLGAVGFAGFKVYKNRQIDAKASGWTTKATGFSNVSMSMCTTGQPVGNDFSGIKTRAYLRNNSSYTAKFNSVTVNPHSNSGVQTFNWGQVAKVSVGNQYNSFIMPWAAVTNC